MNQLQLFTQHEIDAREVASMFDDEGAMRISAPALFATSPHPRMSERYAFTNTYDILRRVHEKGFRVTSVAGGATAYSKVMVRMRHARYDARDEAPEVIVIDSHDGSKRLKLCLGIIKFICMNGMIAGDMLYSKAFTHLAPDLMEQVLLEIEDIQQPIDRLTERVARMKAVYTTYTERIVLADAAIRARFPDNDSGSFIADLRQKMLEVRRAEDMPDDLYTVMNVIQENVLRGGMRYMAGNSLRRMQGINAVDRNVSINQALWRAADEVIERRAA